MFGYLGGFWGGFGRENVGGERSGKEDGGGGGGL